MSDEEIRMRCLELAASLMKIKYGDDTTIDEVIKVANELFIFVRGETPKPSQINWEKINLDRIKNTR